MKSNPVGNMDSQSSVPLGLVFILLFMLASAVLGTALYCFIALLASLFGGHPTWDGAMCFAAVFAFGFPLLWATISADSEKTGAMKAELSLGR